MPPEMKGVYSSSVKSIGYDDVNRSLYVLWESGKTSIYGNVPPDVAFRAENAWSVGKFIREEVQGNYAHRYAG